MGILKPEDIMNKTNMSCDDVLNIAYSYINNQKEEYEVDDKSILYNTEFDINKKPVWYIDIIALKTKIKFPDAYDTLVISDEEKRVVFVFNDHGVIVKSYI